MKIHVHHGDLHLTDLRTRIPFKYGIVTMTSTPHAFLRLRVEVDGQDAVGIAADSLPPKWFTKDPNKDLSVEVDEMLRVIEHALYNAIGLYADSPFDAWRQLYEAQAMWGRREKLPPLLTNFGTSLVERALIEAACRAAGRPFAEMLRANAFGIRLGDLHPSLTGRAPADFLPEKPLTKIIVRQTVGLADPLVNTDIGSGEHVHDGLPQTFADSIRIYGLRHFKIKVSGTPDQDRERLRRIFGEIGDPSRDYAFSLDGNEQFHSLAEFRTFWEEILRDTQLRPYFTHLLFVEQPFHRDVALLPEVVGKLAEWSDRPPLIIDESDGQVESLPQALELGYAGTSYKNCKGVFKGLANACLLAQRRREQPAQPAILSGEDLVNIGPVALLQDLTACATLGIASVERNGHHYFAGLSMFPWEVQQQILKAHFDLYHPTREGWPAVRIKDGTIQVDSLLSAPFGAGFELNVEQFTPLGVWRRTSAKESSLTERK
jgi:hypothetical protein